MGCTLFSQQKNVNSVVLLFVCLSLMGAFAVEWVYHIKPCSLCIYLRYLYGIVLLISVFLIIFPKNCWLRGGQFLSIIAALGLSFFHVGVEQKWWQPPMSCHHSLGVSPLQDSTLTPQEKVALLRHRLQTSPLQTPFVRCDQVNWRLLGVSVTIWNTLLLAGLVVYLWMVFWIQRGHSTKPY